MVKKLEEGRCDVWLVHKRREKGSGTDELTEQTGPDHQRYAKETVFYFKCHGSNLPSHFLIKILIFYSFASFYNSPLRFDML